MLQPEHVLSIHPEHSLLSQSSYYMYFREQTYTLCPTPELLHNSGMLETPHLAFVPRMTEVCKVSFSMETRFRETSEYPRESVYIQSCT